MAAAMGAECANDQGKFWQMHDKLFENPKALSDDNITSYAQAVKLDMGKFSECYKGEKHKAKIQKQQSVVKLGARGTPAFFINGRFLSGAQPFPSFKTLIDEELAKANKSESLRKITTRKLLWRKVRRRFNSDLIDSSKWPGYA